MTAGLVLIVPSTTTLFAAKKTKWQHPQVETTPLVEEGEGEGPSCGAPQLRRQACGGSPTFPVVLEMERGPPSSPTSRKPATLSTAGLVALTFFSVTGGPFGQELIVKAAGPCFAILGYLGFTLLWSVPEALMTAELSAAYPEAAGFAAWTNAAFGPLAAWIDAWCSWISGVVDNAVYPILLLEYVDEVTGAFDAPLARWGFTLGFVAVLTYLCHRGLDLTGNAAIALAGFVLAPFGLFCVFAAPLVRPRRWFRVREERHGSIKLRPWINNIFWNVNYYDSASAFSGEASSFVGTRGRWYAAMGSSVMLCTVASIVPMLVATGASDRSWRDYSNGAYVDVARELAGPWLARWVVVAAASANVGLFVSEMASDAYQLMGMAERGLLPAILARKSPTRGTPTYAILFSALGVVALHALTFEAIIATENLLFTCSTLIELAAFATLVKRHPNLSSLAPRTVAALCLPAALLLLLVAAVQPFLVWIIAAALFVLGLLAYAAIGPSRRRNVCGLTFRPLDEDWTAQPGSLAAFCAWDDSAVDDRASCAAPDADSSSATPIVASREPLVVDRASPDYAIV